MLTGGWSQLVALFTSSILSRFTVEGIRITTNPIEINNLTFSYVIVGGGTAGLTVASRLAENPSISVVVIEAGPDVQNDTLINDPGSMLTAATAYSWQYNTTKQTIGGNLLTMIQGKVLGGSSSTNGMCWTRATIDQYDSLEELGNPGWNFQSMLSYMKKAERFHLPDPDQVSHGATANPSVHSFSGKVDAGFPQPYVAATFAGDVITASRAAVPGLAHNPDINSGVPNGAARVPFSIKPAPTGNKRSHQATGLLWGERVDSLSLASGVKFIATSSPNADPGPEFLVKIKNEVIIASGAIGSPHFLELSGIGDGRILTSLGISVEVDLPAVGTNLQDQAFGIAAYTVQPDIAGSDYTTTNAPYSPSVVFVDLEQALGKQFASIAGGYLVGSIPDRVKEIISSGSFASVSGLEKILSLQAKSIVERKAPVLEFSIFSTLQYLPGVPVIGSTFWGLLPQWRGTVHVTSVNPTVQPELNPRFFLGSDIDLYLAGNATKLIRKIFNTMPLKKYVLAELLPGIDAIPENATDTLVQDFVKKSYAPVLHPLGSVPMLPRQAGGAVGPDLVVYGARNVRVVDSSIIPIQLSAHLSSTVYVIAEKAADMIKASYVNF